MSVDSRSCCANISKNRDISIYVLGQVVLPLLKQSTLATHLKELTIAGLVVGERDGRAAIYRAAYDRMDGVIGFLTQNCCKGLPVPQKSDAGSCGC